MSCHIFRVASSSFPVSCVFLERLKISKVDQVQRMDLDGVALEALDILQVFVISVSIY